MKHIVLVLATAVMATGATAQVKAVQPKATPAVVQEYRALTPSRPAVVSLTRAVKAENRERILELLSQTSTRKRR